VTRLTTDRLVLEPLRPEHADEMVGVLSDPALYSHTGGSPASLEELRERYERQVLGRSADGSQRWLNWILRERATGRAAGYVQATVEGGSADVAWVVGREFQGRGFAREGAAAMVAWLRGDGVETITAHIHADNVASQRVARAIGLVPTDEHGDGEVCWEMPRA
jgi:RimJ/RimL family protein N-acetyltransferase